MPVWFYARRFMCVTTTHDNYKGFDCNPPFDGRETFLDISKASDKVWHDALNCK